MNIDTLTDHEAKEFLSKHSATEILKMHSPEEISIIVKKASNVHKHRPPPTKSIEIVAVSEPKPIIRTPSIPKMASNFGKAMIESAKTGFKQVSKEIYEHRLSICRACPHWEPSPVGHCRVCGCTTAKHKLASSRCPLNPPKWNKTR